MVRQARPTSITTPPYEWEIRYEADDFTLVQFAECDGWTEANRLRVGISPAAIEARQMYLFVHELHHVFLANSGYGHPEKIRPFIEQLIDIFSHQWMTFLQQNPGAIRWLTGGEDPNPPDGITPLEEIHLEDTHALVRLPKELLELLPVEQITAYNTKEFFVTHEA